MKGTVSIEKHQKLEEKYRALEASTAAQISQLTFQLEELKRMVFGAKSERFVPSKNAAQLDLFQTEKNMESPPVEAPRITIAEHERVKTKPKKKPVRLVLPAHLERKEVVLEPELDTEGMVKIGEQRSEVLHYTPADLFVEVTVRPKYAEPIMDTETGADSGERKIHTADLPDRFIPKCIAGESLLTNILVDKFVDHLPLYRTINRLKRMGILIPSSTISGWVGQSAEKLKILYETLIRIVLQATYLAVDETRMEILPNSPPRAERNFQKRKKKKIKRKTHRGFLWGYFVVNQKLIFFDYDESREAYNPTKNLKNFVGTLQTDCYSVYDTVRKMYPNIEHFHCLTHARRMFEKALKNDAARAQYALLLFQKLYALERLAKEENWSIEKKTKQRQAVAKPVLETLFDWMTKEYPKVLPTSPIGKAMNYMLTRKSRMMHYLTDGSLCIDTNPLENAIRPIAVGRKNYLFAGSHNAAQWGAMFYSFFACCKMHQVDPTDWLNDVMKRLPNHSVNRIEELLPHLWKKQNSEA